MENIISLAFPILFFLLFFVLKEVARKKEKEALAKRREKLLEEERVPISKGPAPSFHFSPPPKTRAPISKIKSSSNAYETKVKKKRSVLHKGWTEKGSIKQAFILAEVLKKKW